MRPGPKLSSGANIQLFGITLTINYLQLSCKEYTPTLYITLTTYAISEDYLQLSRLFQAAYTQADIGILPTLLNTSIGYSRKLSNLTKIYIDNEKYSGYNDSFTFNQAIFYNICLRSDVCRQTKIKAFFTMLKDLVLNCYYSNISTYALTLDFDQVYNSIKNYFKEVKYKQNIFFKQNKATIKSVINRNEGISMKKCLKKLINKLWHLQYSLDPEI